MKSFPRMIFALFTLLLAFAFITPDAAMVKRPLTVKSYADQYYLEWTGSAPVVTADSLVFFADTATANVFGVDPYYTLMANNRAATTGPWRSFPGIKIPEKACVYLTVAGDADATTSDVFVQQSATKNGTFVKVGATAQTHTSTASLTRTDLVAIPFVPVLFWKLTVDPTTATDSIEVTAVRILPCDD